MHHPDQAVVTGALSYTGRYVARRLLDEGVSVRTLTRNLGRENPFGGRVPAFPWTFPTLTGCTGLWREWASSTTLIGFGSGGAEHLRPGGGELPDVV